jgi:hypothetical protein
MRTTTFRNAAAPKLFASVRGSRDLSLVAFGGALLTAFALHLGAFIPQVSSAEARQDAPAVQPSTPATARAAVVATQPAPCALPRG